MFYVMARLDKKRQQDLEPIRVQNAINELNQIVFILSVTDKEIKFMHKGSEIKFFPYSGWFTGSTVKDGRGLKNLLKQIKDGTASL